MYSTSFVGGPLKEDFVYYMSWMPSHAELSPQPELDHPTYISYSFPYGTTLSHVTWFPETNVNLRILHVDVRNNLLNLCLAWWSGPFDLYIGFK